MKTHIERDGEVVTIYTDRGNKVAAITTIPASLKNNIGYSEITKDDALDLLFSSMSQATTTLCDTKSLRKQRAAYDFILKGFQELMKVFQQETNLKSFQSNKPQ